MNKFQCLDTARNKRGSCRQKARDDCGEANKREKSKKARATSLEGSEETRQHPVDGDDEKTRKECDASLPGEEAPEAASRVGPATSTDQASGGLAVTPTPAGWVGSASRVFKVGRHHGRGARRPSNGVRRQKGSCHTYVCWLDDACRRQARHAGKRANSTLCM